MSKLLYNLHALCLSAAELRKLNAFHVKCLRRILHISYAYYSRVPNTEVLRQAGLRKLSSILLERQLLLMGDYARRSDQDVMRRSILKAGTAEPNLAQGSRKRGRPRKLWASTVFHHAMQAAGSHENLQILWQDDSSAIAGCKSCVRHYCV